MDGESELHANTLRAIMDTDVLAFTAYLQRPSRGDKSIAFVSASTNDHVIVILALPGYTPAKLQQSFARIKAGVQGRAGQQRV